MTRGVKKENLPSKVCVICKRPFTWRKKWEKVWDEVTTCSKSCNRKCLALKQQAKNRLLSQQSEDNTSIRRKQTDPGQEAITMLMAHPELLSSLSMNDKNNNGAHLCDTAEPELRSSTSSSESGASGGLPLEDSTPAQPIDATNNDVSSNVDGLPQKQLLEDPRAARKAAKKRKKAERRAKREGRADPSYGQKECDLCHKSVDLLIRCTIDETASWHMVCGKCWHQVSGGVVDGSPLHPHYRYGGLWKNRARR